MFSGHFIEKILIYNRAQKSLAISDFFWEFCWKLGCFCGSIQQAHLYFSNTKIVRNVFFASIYRKNPALFSRDAQMPLAISAIFSEPLALSYANPFRWPFF